MALLSYSKQGRTSRGRRRNSSTLTVTHLAALAVVAIFGIIGFTYNVFKREDTNSHGFSVHRRSLHSNRAGGSGLRGGGQALRGSGQILRNEAHGRAPDDPASSRQPEFTGYRHTVAVLTGQGTAGRPLWNAQQLRAALEEVISPVAITWYSPTESAALSSLFGVSSLPAVVYQRPHCIPAICGASPALELRTALGVVVTNVTMDLSSPPATSAEAVTQWIRANAARPNIFLANDHPTKTMVFRHVRDPKNPEEGKPLGRFVKAPKERGWIETPLGAEWVVTDFDAPKGVPAPILRHHKVKGDTLLVMHADECNLLTEEGCVLVIPHHGGFDEDITQKRKTNWDRLAADIITQKKETPTYTKAGFEKTRAPPLLYSMLKDFYEQHNASAVNEEWSEDNIYVNHEASRFQLVDLPESGTARQTMFEIIRPVFEKWAGVRPLQASAIYGVRIYSQNAVLQDHVDRSDTHIISAIINVAQEVTEPWPLEIVGHNMKTAHVAMDPGDMILYEGASCAHGRPTPLQGRFMANVFLHMAPADGAKRFDPNAK